MPIAIDVAMEAGDWPSEDTLRALARSAVDAAIARLGPAAIDSELSILFTDDAAMTTLNGAWRGKDRSTNVLSFPVVGIAPGDDPGPLLGDIVLAAETVFSEAALEGRSVEDHLRHLIVHGFLHLLGYDHENDTDAEEMEAAETAILADMGVSDPYSDGD
ncbi:rRNA maturation RNase YbeY [Oricola cellulosilytica]|uniref:Endoribonuclease YbeY n=1 Tax=Oricola cellulosilytica TaxID=1429082 RepID=A0A4R0PEU5_9HYPH|nr:rRNA maturation RNase YbeY [Oricola cellulosilytica]TCD16335.1 rRNA maturation RNase YbeY [Oricola cellulosilytica]